MGPLPKWPIKKPTITIVPKRHLRGQRRDENKNSYTLLFARPIALNLFPESFLI